MLNTLTTSIYNNVFWLKMQLAMTVSLIISPISYSVEQFTSWTISNSTYIQFVFGAILIDYFLGTVLHFLKKDFSLLKNITGTITKVGLVIVIGYLFEGIKALTTVDSFLSDYMMIVLRLTVFLYPAGSAFMNASILTGGKFPPVGWINKIKEFEKNLEIKNLKNE